MFSSITFLEWRISDAAVLFWKRIEKPPAKIVETILDQATIRGIQAGEVEQAKGDGCDGSRGEHRCYPTGRLIDVAKHADHCPKDYSSQHETGT